MNKRLYLGLLLLLAGCSTPDEPQIVPPTPAFADAAANVNDPIDHRIYADVDPTIDAIWIEWKPDSTHTTTGYVLRRSTNPNVGTDGVLDSATLIAKLETTDQTIEPLPTSFRDTAAITPGATYWYQLQAYHRSPTGAVTNSAPTVVDFSTSFHYTHPVIPLSPTGKLKPPSSGLTLSWHDPEDGGTFQVIVERTDTVNSIYSEVIAEFSTEPIIEYPPSAPSLVAGGQYRWRVKRLLHPPGGSSSRWMSFSILP